MCSSNIQICIKETEIGSGVFACDAIEVDQYVGEVPGDVSAELDTDNCYHIELTSQLALDPHPPFRFLNHSCDPNCELAVVYVDEDNPDELPRVYVVALRSIEADEQLTIDYGWPAEAAIACKCGSTDCRGWVVAKNELYMVGQELDVILALKYPPVAGDDDCEMDGK